MITFDGIPQKEITIDTTTIQPFECLLGAFVGAEFPGGTEELQKYIQKNIKLKKKKSNHKQEQLVGGRVLVRLIIEADGQVSHVELYEGLPNCEICNEKAIQLVQKMPKWQPAYSLGKAESECLLLPIYFNF